MFSYCCLMVYQNVYIQTPLSGWVFMFNLFYSLSGEHCTLAFPWVD